MSREASSKLRSVYPLAESARENGVPPIGPETRIPGYRLSCTDAVPAGVSEWRQPCTVWKLAVTNPTSAIEAGFIPDSASNRPKAPPVARARTEIGRSGMPRPRTPNSDDCAAAGPASRTSAARERRVRLMDAPGAMAARR